MKTPIYFSYSGHSFINATVKLQDTIKDGYFMIDTGVSDSILNLHFFKDDHFSNVTKKDRLIFTSSGTTKVTERHINGTIETDGIHFTVNFDMQDLPIPMFLDDEMNILGILGIDFLVKNRMVIDYEKRNLHVATDQDMQYSNHYSIVAQFIYGLNHYGVPTVCISNGEDDKVMLEILDTGSNINSICMSAKERLSFKAKTIQHEEKASFYSIDKERKADRCVLKFGLMCQREGQLIYLPMNSEYYINADATAYIDEDNEYPVEGILGNDFLFANKCIINCATGYLYSRLWEKQQ